MCSRASKNLAELSQRTNKVKVTSVKLTFLWLSRVSCSLSLLANFSDVGFLRRPCLQCMPSYRHRLHECAGVSLLRSLVQLMEGCVKLPSNDRSTSRNSARVASSSRHSSKASTTMKTFERVRISDMRTSLSWSSVGRAD